MVVGDEAGGFRGTSRFEIIRRIGSGGMGVVYEAYDREQRAPVAIKVLRTLEPEALLRFKNEFRVLQDIRHPNLVSLGELFEEAGQWFFTMEMIHGIHFLEYLEVSADTVRGKSDEGRPASGRSSSPTMPAAGAPAPPPSSGARGGVAPEDEPTVTSQTPGSLRGVARSRLVRMGVEIDEARLRAALSQLARGLHALHRARKVHRDIKPSNILVTQAGRVVLLDFGLVADLSAALPEAYLVGTCWYMAPEQARLRPIGAAADWYSVGVLLYQALTGRLPVQGNAREVLYMKQVVEPPPPDSIAFVPDDLSQLCVDLLRVDPRERPTGREVLRRLGAEEPSSLSEALENPHFVGRAAELSALGRALSAATGSGWSARGGGRPSISKSSPPPGLEGILDASPPSAEPDSRESRGGVTVLVHGESGVGKSSLTRRFVELVAEDDPGALVLAGRCYEREAVPYKAVDGVIDALSRALAPLDAAEVAAVLPRDVGLLGQVFPVMRRIEAVGMSRASMTGTLDPQALRGRLFQAVRELFVRLAERRPVVVLIDDLQWADADSLAMLSEVMRPPGGPRLLLIATMRAALGSEASLAAAGGSAPAGPLGVAQIAAMFSGDVREMHVEALPKGDARALVEALLRGAGGVSAGPPLSADAVVEEAGGHPLFIDELVRRRLMGGAGAETIRLDDALWARIAELDLGSRSLLDLIAVAGAPLVQETAARAAQIELSLFAERASLLRAANLVRTSGTKRTDLIEPYHDRVREAVLVHMDAAAARRLHERLAAALEASEKADPEALAVHFRGAGDLAKAATHAARAAADADRALAFERAARLYQLAIELAPGAPAAERGARWVKLGDALVNAGRGASAASAYFEAAPLVGPEEALDVRRRGAEQLLRSGHIDEAMEAYKGVLSAIGMDLPGSPRRALASLLFRRTQVRLRGLGFHERREEDVPQAERTRIDACWAVASGLGLINTIVGSYFQSRSLLLALDAGEPRRIARALAMEASYSSASGGRARVRTEKLIEATEALARKLEHPYALAWASGAAGVAGCLEGRWQRGYDNCERAEATFRERCTGVYWEIGTMRWFSLWSQSYLGRLASLAKQLPGRLREARARGDLYAAIGHSTGLAGLPWLAADAPDEALERSREAMRQWSQKTFHVEHWWAMLGERQIDLYRGDAEAAHRRVMEQWPALSGSLLLMVQLTKLEALQLRGRCSLMLASQRASEARSLCKAAARDADEVEKEAMPWSTPLAGLLRAGVAFTTGDRDQALAGLREAARGLDSAGMALYAAAARYRLGQVIGGDEGKALIAEASAWMAGEGIVNVKRMTAMHAPGFGEE